MQVLLPPSEGKAWPSQGPRLQLADLFGAPQLTSHRIELMHQLQEVSAQPDALEQLQVGASLQEEVRANRQLTTSPTAPACEIYNGVLYDGAALAQVCAADPTAAAKVLIFSALYGVIRPSDYITGYRLAGGVKLGSGRQVMATWKPLLSKLLEETYGDELLVDCRSGTYQSAWHPKNRAQHVLVKVVQIRNGAKKVVSHFAKHTRGLLTNHLLTSPCPGAQNPQELLEQARLLPAQVVRQASLVHHLGKPAVLELEIP